MKDYSLLSIDGCMEMYGAHIRLCVRDFADVHKHYDALCVRRRKTKSIGRKARLSLLLHQYDTAYQFLFGGGLEDAIDRFSLPLNAEWVKRMALEAASGSVVMVDKGTRKDINVYEQED